MSMKRSSIRTNIETGKPHKWILKKELSLEDIKKIANRILDENEIFFLIIGNPSNLKNISKI